MKALVALLLASQFALPTATAAPVATAGTDPAPVAVTADAAEASDTTNTADATDAPVVAAPANANTNNTVNGHPHYQSRQAIGKFLGCRDNPRYPWCWR